MQETGIRTPKKPLTAAFVRNVKEAGKYFDGNGLFLRVDKAGARYWVQRFTFQGKRREIGLGNPDIVTLSEARETALDNRRQVKAGIDLIQAKKQSQAILTFEEAARKVYEINKPSWRNAKHAAQFISTLETYVFPKFGRIGVADVTTADVLGALQPIWLKKPETARRVRQRIGQVMKWAVAKGWRQENPAETISQALPKQTKPKTARKALPYQEVGEFIQILQASNAGAVTKLAFEMIILTASRSSEVRLARWHEFDFDKAQWIIPADRMKAKREHRVPMSGRVVDILHEAKAFHTSGDLGAGLVFQGVRRGKPLSENTFSKLVKALGYDIHPHGFRTSFKTWAQEQTNIAREVSEAALAHVVKDKAEAAYARSDLFEKRQKLMARWAGYVAAKRGDVVRIG